MILRVRFLDRPDQLHMKVDSAVVTSSNNPLLKFTPVGQGERTLYTREAIVPLCEYTKVINIQRNKIKEIVIISGEYRRWLYEEPKLEKENQGVFNQAKLALKGWYERLFVR